MTLLDAAAIHASISWPEVLERLGIAPEHLRNKHGPCPICGGKDRYRFDDRGRGTWICNQCGSGDGFSLVAGVHGVDFAAARRMVIEAAGLADGERIAAPERRRAGSRPAAPTIASPTARVRKLLSTTSPPETVAGVIEYLTSRKLWPLPAHCTWRARAAADYFEDGKRIGRYPALVARVVDVDDEPVTAHVTYLDGGRKLSGTSRKLLGPVTGRRGCCVRLLPVDGETLGIAEGIETALAAHVLHSVPVWAALNTSLLARWYPPPGVHRVIVFADRDVAGLEAALKLTAELDGRASVETLTPKAAAKDWADALEAQA